MEEKIFLETIEQLRNEIRELKAEIQKNKTVFNSDEADEYNRENESVKEQVPNEMNMKGYKINVFYETITKEEMDRKRAFVAKIIINALMKHKKKE